MNRPLRIVLVATLLMVGGRAWLAPAAAVPGIGPLRIVLLVDSSFAVAPMLTQFRAGLNAFLDALPGDPEITIISTGGQLRVRVAPTTDRQQLRKAAGSFASDGGANSLLETMLEADKRFLRTAPDRRPVIVVITTDNNQSRGEVRIDEYNKFMNDFVMRSGRAHGIVIRGANIGVTSDIVMNLTDNTGGFFDSIAIPNPLADRMRVMAETVGADIPE